MSLLSIKKIGITKLKVDYVTAKIAVVSPVHKRIK